MNKNILLIMIIGMVFINFASAWCYQESANTTNQTGIDGNCGLNYSGTYDELYLGEYGGGIINITYAKPSTTYLGAFSKIKWGNDSNVNNYTYEILNSCYNYNSSYIFIQVNMSYTDIGNINCYNGSWQSIGNLNGVQGCGNANWDGGSGFLYDGNWSFGKHYVSSWGTPPIWHNLWATSYCSANLIFYEEAILWGIKPLILSGNGTQSYGNTNTNHTINYTITDTNLNVCWLNYNLTNRTIPCTSGAVNTTNFTLQYNLWNATIWANDTFGNTASQYFNWDYYGFENSISYTTPVLFGSNQTFVIDLSYDSTHFSNIGATLVYNGTSYSGTRIGTGNNATFIRSINVPYPTTDTNYTFYWNVSLNNGTQYYSTSTTNTQLVQTLSVDNCSTNTKVLYNFTIVDEDLQTKLDGTTKKTLGNINLQIYNLAGTLITSYAKSFNQTNPFGICLNNNLSGGESYKINVQVQYSADGYQKEYYHIQQDTLNAADFTTNITLYDLSTASASQGTSTAVVGEYNVSNYTSTSTSTTNYAGSGYVFKITYKDENFFPVSNAIIQIQRKYVDEGVFKTIEIPITDTNGQTTASLVKNTVIYTFIVLKNGVVLATFDNVNAVCQNEVLAQCEINLNAFSTTVSTIDYTVLTDFSFTKSWNLTTRTFTLVYTIPSGSANTVLLNGTLADGMGTTMICSDTLTSASGTLTCVVPSGYMNQTAVFKVYSNGVQKVEVVIPISQKPSDLYGGSIVFLSIFLMLMVIAVAAVESPMLSGFILIIGLIVGFSIGLLGNTGFYGAGATILFMIIAIIIVLVKGSGRS